MTRIFPLAPLVLALPVNRVRNHGHPFTLDKLSRGKRRYRARHWAGKWSGQRGSMKYSTLPLSSRAPPYIPRPRALSSTGHVHPNSPAASLPGGGGRSSGAVTVVPESLVGCAGGGYPLKYPPRDRLPLLVDRRSIHVCQPHRDPRRYSPSGRHVRLDRTPVDRWAVPGGLSWRPPSDMWRTM